MNLSWKLGRIAGIDVFLHPTLLLVFAWGATMGDGLGGLALSAAVFGCVLLHEFGHALTARRFGIATEDITLYPIGGLARLSRMPRSPGAELLITLAGPAVNVAIAAVLFPIVGLMGTAADAPIAEFVRQVLWINVGLAVFNLLPIFPMDGGRILRAALSGPLGRLRATEIASGIGKALAVVLGLLALYNGFLLTAVLAAFIFMAANAERNAVVFDEQRRQAAMRQPGVWFAPKGYHWVDRGQGVWQLAPIVMTDPRDQTWH